MKHALVCVLGQQNLVGIGETEYDIQVEEIEHPALPLLREIFQAQRTFAREYLFAGQMLRPTHLEVKSIAVEQWVHVLGKPSAHFVDMPRVVHGVFRSKNGRIGYVLVNWSGSSEAATLSLVGPQGEAWIVTGGGRRRVAEDEVATGRVAVRIAPRSVMLIEQAFGRGAVEARSQTQIHVREAAVPTPLAPGAGRRHRRTQSPKPPGVRCPR